MVFLIRRAAIYAGAEFRPDLVVTSLSLNRDRHFGRFVREGVPPGVHRRHAVSASFNGTGYGPLGERVTRSRTCRRLQKGCGAVAGQLQGAEAAAAVRRL